MKKRRLYDILNMRRSLQNLKEPPFQCRLEPLEDIQFDCDEEIKVPILVKLMHKDAEVPKKSHPGSCCYDLKSLETYRLCPKKKHIFDLGLTFKMKKGWRLEFITDPVFLQLEILRSQVHLK